MWVLLRMQLFSYIYPIIQIWPNQCSNNFATCFIYWWFYLEFCWQNFCILTFFAMPHMIFETSDDLCYGVRREQCMFFWNILILKYLQFPVQVFESIVSLHKRWHTGRDDVKKCRDFHIRSIDIRKSVFKFFKWFMICEHAIYDIDKCEIVNVFTIFRGLLPSLTRYKYAS